MARRIRPKQLILGSMMASGAVALLVVTDLVTGVPFHGQTVFDILFLLSAAAIAYLGWESMRELR